MTRRSIEETAAAILKLFTDQAAADGLPDMTLWRGESPLILATQSRARQMLLANAGLDFEAVPADIDERGIQQSSGLTSPGDIAALLAREKARAVSSQRPGQFVVGADQTLALGTRLFSKPAGRAQAAEQLRALAGNRHELHSAVAVARDGNILFETVSVAGMTHAPARPGPKSRPIWTRPAKPLPRASAPTSWKGSACICSSASKAIISPSSACRCCNCSRFCVASSCSPCKRKSGRGSQWRNWMIILGLTGSIGMGKSTTAKLFAEAGVPVYDADATVHQLYEGEAVPAIEAAFPGTTVNGKVDRARLSAQVVHDPAAIKRLEAIVHPMLGASRQKIPR